MKKTLKVGVIGIFLFVGFTACNDNDSNISNDEGQQEVVKNTISSRSYVFIFYNYPPSSCDADLYTIKNNQDVITSVESNSVTCAMYGKRDDGRECDTMTMSGNNSTQSCVIGFNKGTSYRKMSEEAKLIMMDTIQYVGMSTF